MAEQRKTSQNRKNPPAPVLADFGKMPPQALDLEEAVLGGLMLEKEAIVSVLDILKPESFYKDSHQKIFRSMVTLTSSNKPIDLLTVSEELRKSGELEEVGGPYYIAQLTNKVASSAHVEFHARIIAQKYIQRELIRVSSEIQNKAFDDSVDVEDLLNFSEGEMFKIAQGNVKRETVAISELVKQSIQQIEHAAQNPNSLVGVPSGFTNLDRHTLGWQRSDLIILAARPAMGKTAFVLSMARNMAADHKRPVAFFSLEMAGLQLVNRLIVAETAIESEKIKKGSLSTDEWKQFNSRIQNLIEAPIFIDDTPGISIFELRAKCRRLKAEHDIQMVIIDYLQLMVGAPETRGNREQEVSSISRALKALAKELNIPVVALSQLSRQVEQRGGNRRPQLSDLRESGAIEQDADIVVFIHRPEYYGIMEFDDGLSTIDMAEIMIAKHRNGSTADVRLRFIKSQTKFCDVEDMPVNAQFMQHSVTLGSKINNESTSDSTSYSTSLSDFSSSNSFDSSKGEAPF